MLPEGDTQHCAETSPSPDGLLCPGFENIKKRATGASLDFSIQFWVKAKVGTGEIPREICLLVALLVRASRDPGNNSMENKRKKWEGRTTALFSLLLSSLSAWLVSCFLSTKVKGRKQRASHPVSHVLLPAGPPSLGGHDGLAPTVPALLGTSGNVSKWKARKWKTTKAASSSQADY
jgi:hypothetical protein